MTVAPVERVPGRVGAPLALCCEHATNVLPAPWTWSEADARLVDTHWGYDVGVAPLLRAMAEALGAPAVLSRFTRLLVDPNRPIGAETMFRTHCDGVEVDLNRDLDDAERARRIDGFYTPYHDAVDAMLRDWPELPLVSLHTYTPDYEGHVRDVQIGVLFDADRAMADRWYAVLADSDYDVRFNEPWSGLEGLMYSPQHHATRHGREVVELEIRNDLLTDPVHFDRVLDLVVRAAAS